MTCEKCWSDANRVAFFKPNTSVPDEYSKLLDARAEDPCTPEQQCGELHTVLKWKEGPDHCVCGLRNASLDPV